MGIVPSLLSGALQDPIGDQVSKPATSTNIQNCPWVNGPPPTPSPPHNLLQSKEKQYQNTCRQSDGGGGCHKLA